MSQPAHEKHSDELVLERTSSQASNLSNLMDKSREYEESKFGFQPRTDGKIAPVDFDEDPNIWQACFNDNNVDTNK